MITLLREVGKLLFQFKKVHKSYGIQKIFRDLDFCLQRGTFSILTGASGSGKTTLFRLLCGVEKPTAGEIHFLGRRLVEHSPVHLRNIGFIFQSPRGLFDRTVFENVALPLMVDRVPRPEIESRVMAWLDDLGLRHRVKSKYGDLSGGEIQKLEFARAMIRRPRLVLADEPTAHLDAIQSDLLLDILWEHYRNGASVFISTHHPPKFHHPSILRYHIEDQQIRQLSSEEVHIPRLGEESSVQKKLELER
ncbi:MAG: ATP-binding cassette domain-containing protein [Bradymonadales bacterium]|nr:MAG: ATP-binding cassette domain-containing protein [Bradymonadales bacterium]